VKIPAINPNHLKEGGKYENVVESIEHCSGCFKPVYFYLEKPEKSSDPLIINIYV
jgi:hypothetical protein